MMRLKTPHVAVMNQRHVKPVVVRAGCGVLQKETTHPEKKSNGVMPARSSPKIRPR
jgi:hypothetical protein